MATEWAVSPFVREVPCCRPTTLLAGWAGAAAARRQRWTPQRHSSPSCVFCIFRPTCPNNSDGDLECHVIGSQRQNIRRHVETKPAASSTTTEPPQAGVPRAVGHPTMSTPLLTNASAAVPLGARRGAASFARQASVGASKRIVSSRVNMPTLTAPLAARRLPRRLCVANVSTPDRHVLIATRSSHRALRPYNAIYLSALSLSPIFVLQVARE